MYMYRHIIFYVYTDILDISCSVFPYKLFEKELSVIGVRINPFSFPNALGLIESLGER